MCPFGSRSLRSAYFGGDPCRPPTAVQTSKSNHTVIPVEKRGALEFARYFTNVNPRKAQNGPSMPSVRCVPARLRLQHMWTSTPFSDPRTYHFPLQHGHRALVHIDCAESVIRSIEELEPPGFPHNHSTDIIRRHATEKECTRKAVSPPSSVCNSPFPSTSPSLPPTVDKPHFKPLAEFNDTIKPKRPAHDWRRRVVAKSATNTSLSHINHATRPQAVHCHHPRSSRCLFPLPHL
ncbi:hypothetical protein OF83DRAFT_1180064 [Amylostereum chailletii]|nr:hypothetical protein OF83DRAFT_1180064 [Amylostereum chailletii]